MRITFSMILERVSKQLACTPSLVSHSFDGYVVAVAPYTKGMETDDTVLYVAAAVPASDARPRQLFCLGTAADEQAHECIACFSSSLSRSALLAAAQSALAFYHAWGDTILDMIYAGQGFDPIVAFAHDTFKNPFLIYDSSLKVLAYTKTDGSTDRTWQEVVRDGAVTNMNEEEARDLMLYVEKLDRYPNPFKYHPKHLTDPFYSCNIMLFGKRVGMVDLMERNHIITQGELDLLKGFCYLLSFEMQKDTLRRENSSAVYHQLILDLLNGAITDHAILRSRLTSTRWTPTAITRILRLEPENTFMSEAELHHVFERLLSLSLGGRGIIDGKSITFLLSCSGADKQAIPLSILEDFCQANHVRCGISDAYDDLLKTHTMLNQPSLSLMLDTSRIVCFSDVRFKNLLRVCAAHDFPSEILHPAIPVLAAHDAEHQTEYLDTLCALFDCQYNQMLAARTLHIHRTTLFYRLQRICDMTGLNLNDAQDVLFFQFSLSVYRNAQNK